MPRERKRRIGSNNESLCGLRKREGELRERTDDEAFIFLSHLLEGVKTEDLSVGKDHRRVVFIHRTSADSTDEFCGRLHGVRKF